MTEVEEASEEEESENEHPTRGPNKKYVVIHTFKNMEEAKLEFTKEKRIENKQVLGRSSALTQILTVIW
jgi:hypothetical protein